MLSAPRAEGAVLSQMVSAADVGGDGRFSFTGLRDGYYVLALLGPAGSGSEAMTNLEVRGDPGVLQLEPARKTKDLGTITVNY
jgi:hypothetical protein